MGSDRSTTPLPGQQPRGARLDAIDALRGFAAFSVLLYHLALIPKPNLAVPNWASPYILTGGMGVTLFFVVSAFCLCLSMRQHQAEPSPVTRFYLRRFFRIAPLFYAILLAFVVRDRLTFHVAHSLSDILLSVFFGFNFVPGKHEGIVWASWTLGVEMTFYLLFPFIFRHVNSWLKAVAFFFATMAVASVWSRLATQLPIADSIRGSFIHFSFLHFLPVFSLGMVVFFLYERTIKGRNVPKWAGILLVAAALLLYDSLIRGRIPHFIDNVYLQGLIFSLLLIGLTVAPVTLFVNRISRFFGTISYSLYLNHPPLVFLLTPIYGYIYSFQVRPTVQYGACLALTLGLLTAVAYLTFRYIESPGIRLGSKLVKRLGPAKPLTTVPADSPEYGAGQEMAVQALPEKYTRRVIRVLSFAVLTACLIVFAKLYGLSPSETKKYRGGPAGEATSVRPDTPSCELADKLSDDVRPVKVNYGKKIHLLGIGITMLPKNQLRITYYWRQMKRLGTYDEVFVHFTDDNNMTFFQEDHTLCERRPFEALRGRIVKETRFIGIPPSAKGKDFNIKIGLYDASSRSYDRLKIEEAENSKTDDGDTRAAVARIRL